MECTIYHNPRCSKSRAALALLIERGLAPRVVRYLEEPLDLESLERLQRQLKRPARAMLREKEASAQAELSDLDDQSYVLAAIARCPRLMQRPIVSYAGRAVIARPPEDLSRWLDQW